MLEKSTAVLLLVRIVAVWFHEFVCGDITHSSGGEGEGVVDDVGELVGEELVLGVTLGLGLVLGVILALELGLVLGLGVALGVEVGLGLGMIPCSARISTAPVSRAPAPLSPSASCAPTMRSGKPSPVTSPAPDTIDPPKKASVSN